MAMLDHKGAMLTRSEAQAAVHATLEARSRLDPIGPQDILPFAIEMSRILDFPGDDDPIADIEAWAGTWLDARVVRRPFAPARRPGNDHRDRAKGDRPVREIGRASCRERV